MTAEKPDQTWNLEINVHPVKPEIQGGEPFALVRAKSEDGGTIDLELHTAGFANAPTLATFLEATAAGLRKVTPDADPLRLMRDESC